MIVFFYMPIAIFVYCGSPGNAEFAKYRILGDRIIENRSESDAPGYSFTGIAGIGVDAPYLDIRNSQVGVFGYGRSVSPADLTDGAGNTVMVVESYEKRGPWNSGGHATVRGFDPARRPYIGEARPFVRRGGAGALYADGSVRWITDSVDDLIVEALSTIHGGEPIPNPYPASRGQ